ncbi:PGA30 [Candida metapsilosis]|uniref:PGA30 n=1 Tax=Candida metapsilosis TaxID=273372 RepID=A0A8H7ZHB3_9ASCO|nr:PGA30 [Candida metapsilosis]
MRFFIPASLLALSSGSLAAIRQVQLLASSDNEEVNGKGLYSTHEGAGINYFFLGAGQNLQYDDEARAVYVTLGGNLPDVKQSLGFTGNVLSLTVAEPLQVDIAENGTVTFPGSDALAAAKNINDPYRYSERVFAVVKADTDGSIPLKLTAKFGDAGNSTSSTETTTAEEQSTTEAPSAETTLVESSTSAATPAETSSVSVIEDSAAAVGGAGLAAIAFAAAGLVF